MVMVDVLLSPVSFVADTRLPTEASLEAFLDKVRGAPNPFEKKLMLADSSQSAQVNAGSLISFTGKLSGQNKEDVQNSPLFAQLASDAYCDRFQRPMDWYRNYCTTLGKIGWNQPAFAFDNYKAAGTTVKLDEAVLGILAAIASADEIALVKATMQGLSGLSDDSKQMLVWDSNANSGNNGTFQIFPVDRAANDDVIMVLDGMQFTAESSHYRFLWWSWQTNSIKIQRAANKFVLNEKIYDKVRQQIIDRLGDLAEDFVANVPLKF
jgi:hypothetical protein